MNLQLYVNVQHKERQTYAGLKREKNKALQNMNPMCLIYLLTPGPGTVLDI